MALRGLLTWALDSLAEPGPYHWPAWPLEHWRVLSATHGPEFNLQRTGHWPTVRAVGQGSPSSASACCSPISTCWTAQRPSCTLLPHSRSSPSPAQSHLWVLESCGAFPCLCVLVCKMGIVTPAIKHGAWARSFFIIMQAGGGSVGEGIPLIMRGPGLLVFLSIVPGTLPVITSQTRMKATALGSYSQRSSLCL